MYRAPSGALVFGAGTVQWAWGLDAEHDSAVRRRAGRRPHAAGQVNLLADMGAQPTTLMAGLVAADEVDRHDRARPSTITSPAAGATAGQRRAGHRHRHRGRHGGGRVAGVEVSTDGGDTWHPATGTTSLDATPTSSTGAGRRRSGCGPIDDSANIGAAATRARQRHLPVQRLRRRACRRPRRPTTASRSSSACGSRPTTDGFVTGVRFYKGTGNTGTHPALWTASGQLLATGTFTNETATGWQTATFAQPGRGDGRARPTSSSYTAPQRPLRRRSVAPSAAAGIDAAPLTVAGGFGATPAGVYGEPGTFPTSSYQQRQLLRRRRCSRRPTTSPLIGDQPVAARRAPPACRRHHDGRARRSPSRRDRAAGAHAQGRQRRHGRRHARRTTRRPGRSPSRRAPPLAGFVTYTATAAGTDTQGNAGHAGQDLVVHARPAAGDAGRVPVHALRRRRPRRRAGGRPTPTR